MPKWDKSTDWFSLGWCYCLPRVSVATVVLVFSSIACVIASILKPSFLTSWEKTSVLWGMLLHGICQLLRIMNRLGFETRRQWQIWRHYPSINFGTLRSISKPQNGGNCITSIINKIAQGLIFIKEGIIDDMENIIVKVQAEDSLIGLRMRSLLSEKHN